jgi:dolichyl-phosphate beta-glucosyltransferase
MSVKWEHMDGSAVDPIKDSIRMFSDLLKICWLHRAM